MLPRYSQKFFAFAFILIYMSWNYLKFLGIQEFQCFCELSSQGHDCREQARTTDPQIGSPTR